LALYRATKTVHDRSDKSEVPTLSEALTYRNGPHTMAVEDPTHYRTSDEDSDWEKKDPLVRFRTYLEGKDLWTKEQEEEVIEKAKEEIKAAIKEADATEKQTVTGLMELMYDEMPSNLQEQYEYYKGKESK